MASTNPYEALSETELLDKLEKSRQNAVQGNYRETSEACILCMECVKACPKKAL